jgi:hypothetical protein
VGSLVVELRQGGVFLLHRVLSEKEVHLQEARRDGLDRGQRHLLAGTPGLPVADVDGLVVGGEDLGEFGRLFGEPLARAVQAEIQVGGERVGGDQRLQHRVPGVAVPIRDGAGVDVLLGQVLGHPDVLPRGGRRDLQERLPFRAGRRGPSGRRGLPGLLARRGLGGCLRGCSDLPGLPGFPGLPGGRAPRALRGFPGFCRLPSLRGLQARQRYRSLERAAVGQTHLAFAHPDQQGGPKEAGGPFIRLEALPGEVVVQVPRLDQAPVAAA